MNKKRDDAPLNKRNFFKNKNFLLFPKRFHHIFFFSLEQKNEVKWMGFCEAVIWKQARDNCVHKFCMASSKD